MKNENEKFYPVNNDKDDGAEQSMQDAHDLVRKVFFSSTCCWLFTCILIFIPDELTSPVCGPALTINNYQHGEQPTGQWEAQF